MSETVLHTEKTEGYRVITLSRPDKLNSFNETLHTELFAAFADAEQDDTCRAILLTGAGRGFCAGQDLDDRNPEERDENLDLGQTLDRFYNPLIRKMQALPKPIVCAVNGVAAGAGVSLALACDMVFAAKSAKFIQAFCKIGLVPDSGATWFLPRVIGEARAKALMMTGQPIKAEEAEAWGMIWKAVEDDQLMAEARQATAAFAQGPTIGLGLIKTTIHAGLFTDLSTHLDTERDSQRLAGRTPDYAEGVSAFLEKRAPRFTGRQGEG